jgi:hypothetical protein
VAGRFLPFRSDVPLRGRLRRFDRRRRSDSGTGYGRGRQPGLFGLETRSTSTISESIRRAPFDPPDPPFEILDRRGSPKAGPESAEGRGLFVAPPSDVPLRGRRAATGMTCRYGADVPLRGRRAATGPTCRYGDDVPLRGRRAATGPTCRYGADVPLRG